MPMRFLRFPLSENPTTICKFRVERRGQCKWQLICKKVFGFLIKIKQNGITIIIIIVSFVKLIHCPKSTLLILLGLERETSTFLESKLSNSFLKIVLINSYGKQTPSHKPFDTYRRAFSTIWRKRTVL